MSNHFGVIRIERNHSLRRFRLFSILYLVILFITGATYLGGFGKIGTIELGLSFVLLLTYRKGQMIAKVLPMLSFTSIVLILFVFSGKIGVRGFNAPIKHVLKSVNILFSFICYFIVREYATEREARVLEYLALTAIVITCLRSIYAVQTVSTYAIRYSGMYDDDAVNGVAGFYQIYVTPFFLLAVYSKLLSGKRSMLQKMILIALLAVFIVFIFSSLLATVLLLSIAGIGFYTVLIMYRRNNVVIIILSVFLILLALLCFIFNEQTMKIINDLTENMNFIVKGRIRYVFSTLLQTTSETAYSYNRRMELANYSLESFKEHPVFGVGYAGYGYGTIGCHQEWFDMLGVFGIVGAAAFAMILFNMLRTVYTGLETRGEKDLYLTVIIMFVTLGFLNPCLSEPIVLMLFVIAPNARLLFPARMEAFQ